MERIIGFKHNVMNITAMSDFENSKGTVGQDWKEVLFVRAVGVSSTLLAELQNMDEALLKSMNEKRGFYKRLTELPRLQNQADVTFYTGCYDEWVTGGKQKLLTKETGKTPMLALLLSEACKKVEEIYRSNDARVSDSMVKNFMVKLLFWYDTLFWDEKFSGDEKQSIKIVASNIVKKQEYLFFYLITLMGADVLLLQCREDIAPSEEALGLSAMFRLGDFRGLEIPAYHWHETVTETTVSQGNVERTSAAGGDGSTGRITLKIPERNRPSRQKTQEQTPPAPASSEQTSSSARPVLRNPVHPGRTQSQGRSDSRKDAQTQRTPQTRSTTPPQRTAPVQSGNDVEKSFEELAQLASSVVLIAVYDEKGERIGSGSGIMIGKDGYILTNNHVACGGRSFSVRIEDDEKEYRTDEIIKYHSLLDLAIIRIQRKLNPIPVYKGSKPLVRGQKVVAIGSPLGLFNSVSNGIISGFREIDDVDMIQFTAPISRGSSGGAVLNMQGEVIGISTAGIDAGQNINLAMGYECINMFIKGFI